jgi:hypothetical protein
LPRGRRFCGSRRAIRGGGRVSPVPVCPVPDGGRWGGGLPPVFSACRRLILLGRARLRRVGGDLGAHLKSCGCAVQAAFPRPPALAPRPAEGGPGPTAAEVRGTRRPAVGGRPRPGDVQRWDTGWFFDFKGLCARIQEILTKWGRWRQAVDHSNPSFGLSDPSSGRRREPWSVGVSASLRPYRAKTKSGGAAEFSIPLLSIPRQRWAVSPPVSARRACTDPRHTGDRYRSRWRAMAEARRACDWPSRGRLPSFAGADTIHGSRVRSVLVGAGRAVKQGPYRPVR